MLGAVGVGAFVSGSEDVWLGASSLVRGIDGLEIHHGLKFKLSMLGATPSPQGSPPLPQSAELLSRDAADTSRQSWGDRVGCRAPSSLPHLSQEALDSGLSLIPSAEMVHFLLKAQSLRFLSFFYSPDPMIERWLRVSLAGSLEPLTQSEHRSAFQMPPDTCGMSEWVSESWCHLCGISNDGHGDDDEPLNCPRGAHSLCRDCTPASPGRVSHPGPGLRDAYAEAASVGFPSAPLRQLTSFTLRVSKEGPFVTDGPQGTGDVVCGRRGLGT